MSQLRPTLRDLGIVLAWFAVAALIGAVVWWQVTPLASVGFNSRGEVVALNETQLGVPVSSDGWFFVIALVGGLVSGIGLVSWRRRDPVLMVVLVAACGVLATWLMLRLGLVLGPGNPKSVLEAKPTGSIAHSQLKIEAQGLWVVWSVAALIGAVGVIWGSEQHE